MASSARVKKAEAKSGINKNSIEVFSWLKTLPLAPEYHPTLAEFQDPIAFIHKIEKEASKYGICKIIPPVSQPSKKDTIFNLNKSLLARSGNLSPTFTTRQQQVGFCPRKHRPVKKPVWQSGESYTVQEFEAKAKLFEKGYLKRVSKKALSPLEVETLYWKATLDKPFSVEYANDMPGSAFVPLSGNKSGRVSGEGLTVGETAWNMRGVSRSDGSLLKYMKEEIPGVTSPMVYLAMMFSWFAWHVEDHDLHSLNYMHMGAGKTWYGVPREAAVAFEDVIKVHGYGGEINPIVTFATLGEKTTVMSPEVLVKTGVPCCRLVQNAGEFVVTFPRAYHSGFSHGFNCGEAANIATPEWVRLARDAAIRRASINSPPMVSHFQLLYDLALSLSSRVPMTTVPEPRSSRLKDKKKGEGETLVKELFVQDVMQNIELLNTLGKGSPIVLLPRDSINNSIQTKSRAGYLIKANSDLSLGLCSTDGKMKVLNDIKLDRKKRSKGPYSMKGKFPKSSGGNRLPLFGGSNGESCASLYENENTDTEGERRAQCDRLPNKGLFSCVTCGILCYACIAIVKPREVAARYLISANCTNFTECGNDSKVNSKCLTFFDGSAETAELSTGLGWMTKKNRNGLVDVPRESVEQGYRETTDGSRGINSYAETHIDNSSLGLLALTYGDSSDSEEDQCEAPVNAKKTEFSNFSAVNSLDSDDSGSPSHNHYSGPSGRFISFPLRSCEDGDPLQIIDPYEEHGCARADLEDRCYQTSDRSFGFQTNNPSLMADSFKGGSFHSAHTTERSIGSDMRPIDNRTMSFVSRADEDSSRYHVFCLQHAAEVEQKLLSVGGVHLLLLCHPDYPKFQAEAKLMADELGSNHIWNDITFRAAAEDEKEKVKLALHNEESIHGNGDWAVKLEMNLFYSANLSRSPLYSQQMPYNSVIYSAFGCSSSDNDPAELKLYAKGSGRQKKIIVAGKWCGKVWMSNQVHALLAGRDDEREKERNFLALPAPEHPKPSVKLEKPSKTQEMDIASVSCRVERKRKSNTEIRSASRAKSLKIEEPAKVLDDAPDEKVIRQYKRNFRNKRKKEMKETPHPMDSCEQETKQSTSHIEDVLEGGPSTRLRKRTSQPPTENRAKLVKAKSVTKKRTSNMEETSQTPTENRAKPAEAKSVTKKQRSDTEGTSQPPSENRPKPAEAKSVTKKQRSDTEGTSQPPSENRAKLVEGKSVTKKQTSNKEGASQPPTEKRAKLVEVKSVTKKQTSNMEVTSQQPAENRAKLVEAKSVTKKQRSNTEGKKVPKIKALACNSNKNRGSRNKSTDSSNKNTSSSNKNTGNSNKNTSSSNKNTGNSNKNTSDEESEYACEIDGCTMSFSSKQELMQHKRNICPVKGCGKKFFSHKYLVQHRRVHIDDRPLKCPWKGCKMTFKWAWARTEHIRVHTGVRPYICNEDGCGQTFRFVSDFSRHKRKTGHSTKTTKKANK